MAGKTLTTANSSFTLQVVGLYPVPQIIEGYSTDESFMAEDVTTGEAQMGVDGKLSAGFIPYSTTLKFVLQADSPSMPIMDNILAAQVAAREMYVCNSTIVLQGNGDKYALTKGFLLKASPMAGSKKILQPRSFEITFENCSKAPS